MRRDLRKNDYEIQRARAATTVAVEREDDAGALAGRGTVFFFDPDAFGDRARCGGVGRARDGGFFDPDALDGRYDLADALGGQANTRGNRSGGGHL